MAANPALVMMGGEHRAPAPFQDEVILCCRGGMRLQIDNLNTSNGSWKADGELFMTNMRMVFIANRRDADSGLEAFDLPLSYIRKDSFEQPIFGCNHLAGECWPVGPQGGPYGTCPPHKYRIYFLKGGVGTVLPIYQHFLKLVRAAEHDRRAAEELANQAILTEKISKAFVDPNDPTTIYLTQPVSSESRLDKRPVYAANFGADESYQPMV